MGGGDTLLLLLLLPCREASSLHGTDSCIQIFEAGDEADRNSSGGGLRIEDVATRLPSSSAQQP